MQFFMKIFIKKISPILVIAGLLIVWELVVRLGNVPLYILPAPTKIIESLLSDLPTLLRHSLVTVLEALIGMAISFVVAVLFGTFMDALPGFKR